HRFEEVNRPNFGACNIFPPREWDLMDDIVGRPLLGPTELAEEAGQYFDVECPVGGKRFLEEPTGSAGHSENLRAALRVIDTKAEGERGQASEYSPNVMAQSPP